MENKIIAIKLDMSALPGEDSEKIETVDVSERSNAISTGDIHRRRLEIILDDPNHKRFRIQSSFAYWMPDVYKGILGDEELSLRRTVPALYSDEVKWPYGHVTYPANKFYGKAITYGKFYTIPTFNSNHVKFPISNLYSQKAHKAVTLRLGKIHSNYEFYSMDKDMKVHRTKVHLRYVPLRDLIKLYILYDNEVKAKVDTNGNYKIKYLNQLHDNLKEGNLLSEEDFTLYLGKELPIKVYAELSDQNPKNNLM